MISFRGGLLRRPNDSELILIHTSLQRGVSNPTKHLNRFNGFHASR